MSARIFRWRETVDWPTPEAATISPTLIGVRRRDTSWMRVASFDAWLRPSNISRPNTRSAIR